MRIKDREFKPYISAAELEAVVSRTAERINRDYAGRRLVICPVLMGAFVFAADLVRRIEVENEVCFVRYASYSGMSSTGEVRCLLPFPKSVEGREVLIVEDVVDTGLTMQRMLKDVRQLNPSGVEICTLFFKPDNFCGGFDVRYVGREIGSEFIVGYGLDYDGLGRGLPEVRVVDDGAAKS